MVSKNNIFRCIHKKEYIILFTFNFDIGFIAIYSQKCHNDNGIQMVLQE